MFLWQKVQVQGVTDIADSAENKCGRLCSIINIHCQLLTRALASRWRGQVEVCEIRGVSILWLHPRRWVWWPVRMEIFLQTSFILHSIEFHPGDISYFPTTSVQAFQMVRNAMWQESQSLNGIFMAFDQFPYCILIY